MRHNINCVIVVIGFDGKSQWFIVLHFCCSLKLLISIRVFYIIFLSNDFVLNVTKATFMEVWLNDRSERQGNQICIKKCHLILFNVTACEIVIYCDGLLGGIPEIPYCCKLVIIHVCQSHFIALKHFRFLSFPNISTRGYLFCHFVRQSIIYINIFHSYWSIF